MVALVQDHAADQLDVEMALAERALGRLANGGEGGDEQVVEGGAGGELLAEVVGAGGKVGVREGLHVLLERVDLGNLRRVGLEAAIVGGTEKLAGESADTGHQNGP